MTKETNAETKTWSAREGYSSKTKKEKSHSGDCKAGVKLIRENENAGKKRLEIQDEENVTDIIRPKHDALTSNAERR